MPDETPENLGEEQFDPNLPGGPSLQPGQDYLSQKANQAKGKIGQKTGQLASKKLAGKAAGEGVADATTAGTGGIGAILRPAVKWATEQIVNKLLSKDWWKIILKLYWPQIATFLLIVGIAVVAGTMIMRAYRGFWGRPRAEAASIYSDEDVSNVDIILGKQYQLSGNPREWYFSQSDPQWAGEKLAGWTRGPFKAVGCAITSGAMIMKYYGATNVNPLIYGQYHVKKNGSASMNPDIMVQFLGDLGINKTLVGIPKSISAINGELQAGNPILARGYGTFESSQQHWVVITGLKGNQLIINNPSRGANRRVDYEPGKIKGLWALHDK